MEKFEYKPLMNYVNYMRAMTNMEGVHFTLRNIEILEFLGEEDGNYGRIMHLKMDENEFHKTYNNLWENEFFNKIDFTSSIKPISIIFCDLK